MDVPATGEDRDVYLDILGQQPELSIYTQICLCFALPNPASHSAIIDTLTNGLERLTSSFPWVSGKVVGEGIGKGNAGLFKIKPLDKIPRLVVKDLRNDASIPTMDVLRQAEFPISMLDESIVAPRNTLPTSEEAAAESPVFLLQATFITGGLLLTFNGQHQTMDMTGQGQLMHLLSKACRNERFTSEELASGNLDRQHLIPLLEDSYQTDLELKSQIVKPQSSPIENADASPTPECTWANFSFPLSALTALKSLSTQTLTSGYVSTDDTLSAFIWQSILRARQPRLPLLSTVSFARAVDVRRYLSLPGTYPGLVQNMTYHNLPLSALLTSPLGAIAKKLREAVDPHTSSLAQHTRALATFLSRQEDKTVISFTATLDLGADLMLSSWAKVDCYGLDFGLGLGLPEAVRRPRFVPVESLIYFMPKRGDGEIVVAICLRREDLERLREDEEFGRFGKYIG